MFIIARFAVLVESSLTHKRRGWKELDAVALWQNTETWQVRCRLEVLESNKTCSAPNYEGSGPGHTCSAPVSLETSSATVGGVAMEAIFFVARHKNKLGPFGLADLRAQFGSGQLQLGDMVLRQGAPKWVPASSIEELFPPSSSPPSAPRPCKLKSRPFTQCSTNTARTWMRTWVTCLRK
jgi:hypothetical protein